MNSPENPAHWDFKQDFWQIRALEWYMASCTLLDYPRVPLEEAFAEVIRREDSVIDVGCGPGATSLYLSKLCAEVYAVDPSVNAISNLRRLCAEQEVRNVTPLCTRFPDKSLPQCDVSVTLYVNKMFYSLNILKALLDVTRREGLILVNHADSRGGMYDNACAMLGVEPMRDRCKNGCYMMGVLQSMGIECTCRMIEHDFGQPVQDAEEAAQMLRITLRLEEEMLPRLREIAPKMIEKRGGLLYVPNMRRSCLIHFKK